MAYPLSWKSSDGLLARMERDGIKVDRAALSRLSNDFAQRIAELETEIHELAGRPFTALAQGVFAVDR